MDLQLPPEPGFLRGIDVSHDQGTVPWKSVQEAGIHYAFVKATESGSDTDAKFAENWSMTKECGVLRGAYHFFHPTKPDAETQAKHFLSVVPADDMGELPLVLDVERNYASAVRCDAYRAHVQRFVDDVYQQTGRKMMLYSSHGFWKKNLCNTEAFHDDHLLWLPSYEGEPMLPGGADAPFWQFSPKGHVGKVAYDPDRFEGDVHALVDLVRSNLEP